MNPTVNRIQDAYPRYSQRFLNVVLDDYLDEAMAYLASTGRSDYNLAQSFSTDPMAPADCDRIEDRKVVCMSLYFKAATFARRKNHPLVDQSGQIPMEELTRVNHPAWEGSPRFEKTFMENFVDKVLNSDFGDWIPLVYLAEDLSVLEPVFREKGWVVVRVRHKSSACCPGSMWRFLSFNLNCRFAYIQDTDRNFARNMAERFIPAMDETPSAALARPLQWSSPPAGEMTIILGNDFLVRPKNIDFDAARTMLGYNVLNFLLEDRINNFTHEPLRSRDDCRLEPMSKRRVRDHFGPHPHERVPHKCYPFYGFDEAWLREFLYYHLSDGRMITFLQKREKADDVIQMLDLKHQRMHGNRLIPG